MKYIDLLNAWTGRVVSFTAGVLVLLIVTDLVARNVFASPIAWSFDVSTHLYAALFMLLGGYTLLHNSHATVDVLTERFPRKLRLVVDILCYLVFFFPFVFVIIVYGYRFAARSWAIAETTWGAAAIPVYPVKSVIVVAGCLLALQGFVQVARRVEALTRRT